jgi:hypothetical protein
VQLVQLWPIGQMVRMRADSVKIRYQDITNEDREEFMCAVVTVISGVHTSVTVIIKHSYDL